MVGVNTVSMSNSFQISKESSSSYLLGVGRSEKMTFTFEDTLAASKAGPYAAIKFCSGACKVGVVMTL